MPSTHTSPSVHDLHDTKKACQTPSIALFRQRRWSQCRCTSHTIADVQTGLSRSRTSSRQPLAATSPSTFVSAPTSPSLSPSSCRYPNCLPWTAYQVWWQRRHRDYPKRLQLVLSTWDNEPPTPSGAHRHTRYPSSQPIVHGSSPTSADDGPDSHPITLPTQTARPRQPGPDIPSSRCPPPLSLILDASPTVGLRPVQSKHICTSPTATGVGTDAIPKYRLVSHSRPARLLLPLSLPMFLSESPVLVHLSHPTATQPSRSSKEPTTCNSG